METTNKASVFDKLSLFFLQISVFLIPFFFLPFVRIPLDISKGFLFSTGVVFSFLFYLIGRLIEGSISLPRTRILMAFSLVTLSFVVASILSPNFRVSFWGGAFDVVTGSGSILLLALLILSASFFKEESRLRRLLKAFFVGFIPLALFQIAYITIPFNGFFAKFFTEASPSLIGNLNNLAIFTGATIILALLVLEHKVLSKGRKIFLYGILALGLLVLTIVNFTTVWGLVGLAALMIFVYKLSRRPEHDGLVENISDSKIFSIPAFITILVSLLFVMSSATLGSRITTMLGTSNVEVRPSLTSSFSIFKKVTMENPVTGSGPNRFAQTWLIHKPSNINSTAFWDTGFPNAFSTIFTFFITTGILGLVAWLFFFFVFAKEAVRPRIFSIADEEKSFSVFSSLALALYFWIVSLVYVPNAVNFIFAIVMTGAFIGAMVSAGVVGERKISFLGDPRASFFSILFFVVLMILTAVSGYVYIEKFSSVVLYNKVTANTSFTPESLDKTERTLIRAIELSEQDAYYRTLSEVYLYKLSYLISQKNTLSDAIKPELQTLLDKARASSEAAVKYDPTDYFNRLSLARTFEALVPLKVAGAYENALSAYEESLKRNPGNPGIYLSLARLEISNQSNQKAREYINNALQSKGNFVEAMFLLAQIEQAEGNIDEAIKQATQATVVAPTNASAFLELGLLKYNAKDFSGAVGALERSVILSPNSVNVHYFLGLAYAKSGRTNDALAQMRAISTQYPDNQDMKKIIQNLEAGRDPLDGISQKSSVPANESDLGPQSSQ